MFGGWKWLTVVLGAWVWSAAALAQSAYCDRPLQVALFDFGVLYRADWGDGIDVRFVNALAQRTGCKVEYVVLPRARIWQEMERGTLDVATAAIPTPERQRIGYLLPYFRTRNHALLRSDSATHWDSLEALIQSSARMGVVRSFRHEAALDAVIVQLRAQGRVQEAADSQENLRLLREGVVDVVFAQPLVYRSYLTETELADLRVRDWLPADQESVGALMLARKRFSPAQAKAWDALVNRMLKDGSLLRIYEAFLTPRQARDGLYRGPRPTDF